MATLAAASHLTFVHFIYDFVAGGSTVKEAKHQYYNLR